ncbi:MAG: hypothetical protein KDI88_18400, partial [Gammaproteobacteria bacterium]|nr:hypothetical protein [Gammaproteobacteria bacterium]
AGKANERQILQPRAKRAGFIGVSDGTKSRALDLLNTLLLACDANQIAVSVDTEKSPVLRLQADGEDLGLTISEKVYRKDHVLTEKEKRSKYTWGFPRYDYFPSGVLTLQIHGVLPYGTRTAWSDGKVKHLEDKVAEIVRGIFAVAKAQAAERIAAEQRRIAREEERRRWEEAERLRRQKKQRRVHLEKLAAQWHEAQRLAAFIEAVEADLDALAEVEIHGQPVNEWLIEAKQAVVAANPLRNAAWWDIEKQVPSWEIR